MKLEAIVKRIEVALAPAAAFALFTREMGAWWPLASHACAPDGRSRIAFDERVGGEVTETASDGRRHVWGTITEWAPPQVFAMSWHPGRPAEDATLLRVTFDAAGPQRCAVTLVHDGWAARGEAARTQYDGGWVGVLARYGELGARRASAGG